MVEVLHSMAAARYGESAARHRPRGRWRAGVGFVALLLAGASVSPRMAGAQEVWQFVDQEGVLHLGNAPAASVGTSTAGALGSVDPPAGATERRLTVIHQTWKLRYPAYIPSTEGAGASPEVGLVARRAGGPVPRNEEIKSYLEEAARTHAVDPALVMAVAAAESAFNADAVSHKGALGLMQIMPATAARYGVAGPVAPDQRHAILEPKVNALVGARYLSDLLRRYGGDKTLAVAAYNAGEGAVAKYGNRVPPYPETQQYVERVMRFYGSLTQ